MKSFLSSIELLEKLVSFPTVSKQSNLDMIHFIANYLEGFGVQSELIYNETKTKANLFASVGNIERQGVVLSGHTDVVPVEGQRWDSDPFKLKSHNERLYGRGTCDMKGFIAVALAALPEMVESKLKHPIHFAFSYDEEIGCVGVHSMIDAMMKKNMAGSVCIVGEPTSMRPVAAHKGKSSYRCHLTAQACHSSMAPKAINTIELAAEVILHIRDVMVAARGKSEKKSSFEFPFMTANVGLIKGGSALNIVPQDCSFDVEFRYPPGWDSATEIKSVSDFINTNIASRITARFPKGDAVWEKLNSYPAFSAQSNRTALEMAKAITHCEDELAVNYGTEAGLFAKSGFSSVICGPGSIEQAHQPNEFVELKQLSLCEKFIHEVVNRCL